MSRPRRVALALAVGLPAVLLLGTAALVALSQRSVTVGPEDGRLRPCPDSPNCVSSQETSAEHAIEPLRFEGDPDAAFAALVELVRAFPRAEVVTVEGGYLHAVVRTPVLRFADDLELLLDRDARTIHVRSASRVGRSDLGANRARVEALRERWRASGPDRR